MVARRRCISSDGSVFTASVQLDHGRSRYRRVIRGQAIVAEHESVCGTTRTWRDVRLGSVMRSIADMICQL
jgi:hypothetical protein